MSEAVVARGRLGLILRQLTAPGSVEWERAQRQFAASSWARNAVEDIPPWALDNFVGIERIVLESTGYRPALEGESGLWAYVTPATHIDGAAWLLSVWPRILEPDEARELLVEVIDLVAWTPQTPQLWARRWGNAAFLGVEGDGPVKIARNPYSWLKGGCSGICPLDDKPILRGLEYVAEDKQHARELRGMVGPRIIG